MKLNYNSWHCHVYRAVYNSRLPNDFCSYFWKVIVGLFLVPFFTPYLAVVSIYSRIRKEEEYDYNLGDSFDFVERFLSSFVGYVFLVVFFAVGWHMIGLYSVPLWLSFVPWLVGGLVVATAGGTILIIIGLAQLLSDLSQRRSNHDEPKSDGFFSAKIKAVKGKYCPRIDWN